MTTESTRKQRGYDVLNASCEDTGKEAAKKLADPTGDLVKKVSQNSVETTSQASSGWEMSLASLNIAGRQGSVANSYTAGRKGSSWTAGRSDSRTLSARSDEVGDGVGGHDDGDSGSEDSESEDDGDLFAKSYGEPVFSGQTRSS